MSAETEVLRRAAALMRERAAAAETGPWVVSEAEGQNRDARRTLGTFSLIHDGAAEVAIVRGFSGQRDNTAEHIASWHPAVALAVADMLDAFATDWEISGANASPIHPVVRVARAYLGETA